MTLGSRRRQQDWALHAYRQVAEVPQGKRNEYRITVNDLGANVLRTGLAGAVAVLEREEKRGGGLVLTHLAAASIAGLVPATGSDLGARVRGLGLDEYMIATREVLQVATWLRRAVQATFDEG